MNGRDHHSLLSPLLSIAMRAGGVAALGLAWLCGHELWRYHAERQISAAAFLLALATFLIATLGSAMLIVGPHLFDQVEVSGRWTRRTPARPRNPVE